ncbi:hypothetical protein GCM10025881_40050 [Pseudolysinimonas kribbensis]|uniref:Enhanced intracellular survival protein domain-containing protein n=1 Tax=Pseudolysinimonas kribbensis TaxID=433641 RepID=A0ABQ6K918_9MICO|nr:hypothetical protein [Pseudolysinimonas kribbensis]GMA97181.1 hypothetical protein GCM10025881_40050 [Pseudolysinimonas kribbensis]
MRVLDPVAALGSRRYRGAVAETIVLDIRDDLGHAAGLFEVDVRGERRRSVGSRRPLPM